MYTVMFYRHAIFVPVRVNDPQPKPESHMCRLIIDVLTVEEAAGIIVVHLIALLISGAISLTD